MSRKKTALIIVAILVLLIVFLLLRKPQFDETVAPVDLTEPTNQFTRGPGDYDLSLMHEDRTRTYRVHVPPSYDGNSAVPMVFVIHGGGGNAANAEKMANMVPLADSEGFIAVYPDGAGKIAGKLETWNSGICCGYSVENDIDDVGFFRKMIAQIEDDFNIDPKRIFSTGLSNGAMMSYVLACELSDKIAAVAPVAGSLGWEPCEPTNTVSLLAIHGTEDHHVPFEGGFGSESVVSVDHPSQSDSIGFWIDYNGCSGQTTEEFGSIIHDTYDCPNGVAVEFYTIIGGGHSWPGGTDGLAYGNVDTPTQEISATELAWEFFKNHPKNG